MPVTFAGGIVTVTLTEEAYQLLTATLGFAAGVANNRRENEFFWMVMRLANRIHEGDPNWMPYNVPEKAS